MFDVVKDSRMSDTEKLLYNIWQELKQLNANKEENTSKEEDKRKDTFKCKVCDKEYENKGKLLACLKKHKKEDSKNVNSNTNGEGN